MHEIASFTRTIVVNPFTCPTHDSTDAVVGTPNTPNVNGLPTAAPPLVKSSLTWNVVVDAAGDVKKNVYVVPPPTFSSDGAPDPPALYTGTEKSDDTATDGPSESSTVTVHEIASFTRTYVVDPLPCPMHASVDAVLALATLNVNGLPPEINAPLDDSDSVIWNVAAAPAGAVKKNVKLVPPPTVTSDGVPDPPDVYVGVL